MRSGWQTRTSLVLDTYMSYNETTPWRRGPAPWTQFVLPPKIRHRFVPAREEGTRDSLECRVLRNLNRLQDACENQRAKATWIYERALHLYSTTVVREKCTERNVSYGSTANQKRTRTAVSVIQTMDKMGLHYEGNPSAPEWGKTRGRGEEMRGVFGLEGRYRNVIRTGDQSTMSSARDLTDGKRMGLRRLLSLALRGESPIRHSFDEGGRQMTGRGGTVNGKKGKWA